MWTCPKCNETIDDQFDTCWKCAGRRDATDPGQTPPQPASAAPTDTSSGAGAAFVKGGCGCLVIFIGLAFLAVLFGGHAHADLGGLILLFVIGGVIGLVVFAIYNKGRKDANPSDQTKKDSHDG